MIACGGSFNCSGCLPQGVQPIPGGFPADFKLDRSAQVRLTRGGLDMIENKFSDLLGAYQAMSCGGMDDLECPSRYNSMCDVTSGYCIDQMSGDRSSVLAFPIEQSTSSGATICRDSLTDPNRRDCAAWIKLESLKLTPKMNGQLEAKLNTRVYTSEIPIRVSTGGLDCIVTLDSESSGSPLQEFTIDMELNEWGAATRQLSMELANVDAMIATDDLRIAFDPVHGSFADRLGCAIGNIGAIKQRLVDELVGELSDTIDEALQEALGQTCGRPSDPPCPTGSTCNSGGYCLDTMADRIVPQVIGLEGRADLSSALQGAQGDLDLSFVVGGTTDVDMTGLSVSLLGGLDMPAGGTTCVAPLAHPATRTSSAPLPFPIDAQADLDWDGTPESSFMMAAGISQPLLDHAMWLLYSSGMLCQNISSADSSFINTGSLSVLMPSLRKLTHADRIVNSDALRFVTHPAQVVLRPGSEGRLRIGSGRMTGLPNMPMLEDALITLELEQLEIHFSAVVEERWIHLMTVRADVAIPLGMFVTPSNSIELMIGDIDNAVTNVQILNHKILEETAVELKDAIPTLISLVLPQLTQALQVPLQIPPAAGLGGFEVDVLGIRGVEDGQGAYSHIGVYADLDFDASMVPNLSLAANTPVRLVSVDYGSSSDMSVRHVSGPQTPVARFELDSSISSNLNLEYQYRIDGGLWSAFFQAQNIEIRRPEFLSQGVHQVDFRARVIGDYRSLDPHGVSFEIVIDTEAPILTTRRTEQGHQVNAFDVVSGDQVRFELAVDGDWSELESQTAGMAVIDGRIDPFARIEVAAIDEYGHRAKKVLQVGGPRPTAAQSPSDGTTSPQSTGCRCVSQTSRNGLFGSFVLLLGGFFVFRRRTTF